MNPNLMAIALESLAFLELCGPDVVQPEVAVSQTHQILSGLDVLTESEKEEFSHFTLAYAHREETAGAPPQRVRFLRSIPLLIGFAE